MAVYFIVAGNFFAIKVGVANHPFRRLGAMQTHSPMRLTIAAIIDDASFPEESLIHSLLEARGARILNEWFDAQHVCFLLCTTIQDRWPASRIQISDWLLWHIAQRLPQEQRSQPTELISRASTRARQWRSIAEAKFGPHYAESVIKQIDTAPLHSAILATGPEEGTP
jgi:hypothetical protein